MIPIYDNDFEKAFDEAVDALGKKEHRLIYADKLKAHYSWWKGGTREMTMDEAKNDFDTIIDLQPTVELKPIVIDGEEYLTGADYNAYLKGYKDGKAEPTKHGRWIKDNGNWWHCSECGQQIFSMSEYDRNKFHKWCGSCGARMDAQIGEDKSHPFAESVMMGMDEVEE